MNKLKYLRMLSNLTQIELSTKTKIKLWKISFTENGHDVLKPKEKKAIAKVLKINKNTNLYEYISYKSRAK